MQATVRSLVSSECTHSSMLYCFSTVDGVEMFEEFLRTEFNDENILFWKACERFKTIPEDKFEEEADAIFEEYLVRDAPKLVSLCVCARV